MGLELDKSVYHACPMMGVAAPMGYGAGWVGTGQVCATGSRWGLKRDPGSAAQQPKADGMAEPELLRMGRDNRVRIGRDTFSGRDGRDGTGISGRDMNGTYPLRGLSRPRWGLRNFDKGARDPGGLLPAPAPDLGYRISPLQGLKIEGLGDGIGNVATGHWDGTQ